MRYQKYRLENWIGKQVYCLKIIGLSDIKAKHGQTQWEFECLVCGKHFVDIPYRVFSGHRQTCGCLRHKNLENAGNFCVDKNREKPENLIGTHNNRLTVTGYVKVGRRMKLECLCDCGGKTVVYPWEFRNGTIKSCGCLAEEIGVFQTTHGMSNHPLFSEWSGMMSRCYNSNDYGYFRYGKRGIVVCDEWHDIHNFIKWVESTGGRPDGKTLDRIDNNGPYAPWNCRWSIPKEQQRNTRSNHNITYNGKTQCISAWAEEIGIPETTIRGRIRSGWPIERVLTEPVHKKG